MATGRQEGPGGLPRWAVVVLLLPAIAALLAWSSWATATGRLGDVGLLDRPRGTEVVLSLQPVVEILDAERYVVGERSLRFPVRGDTAGLALGVDVTVGGHVGDGEVVADWQVAAPGRPAKRRLGYLGLLVLAAAVAATTRRTDAGWRAVWPIS